MNLLFSAIESVIKTMSDCCGHECSHWCGTVWLGLQAFVIEGIAPPCKAGLFTFSSGPRPGIHDSHSFWGAQSSQHTNKLCELAKPFYLICDQNCTASVVEFYLVYVFLWLVSLQKCLSYVTEKK